MNATEPTLTTPSTTPPTKTTIKRRRLTLDERIAAAQGKLAAKEAERDQLAKALHSLRASKMNKDRNAERKARNQRLILMGVHFEKILKEIPILLNENIKYIEVDIDNLKIDLNEAQTEKERKKITKDITDKNIILTRLIEIKGD